MSYDVCLEVLSGSEYVEIAGTWRNYTFNVRPMFVEALGGNGLLDLNGLNGKSAADKLGPAISLMQAEPGKYREMNPENGWGSYDGALAFLQAVYVDCRTHYRARLSVTA